MQQLLELELELKLLDIPVLFCTNLLFLFYILYFISFFIHAYIVQVEIYVTIRYFTYSYHNKKTWTWSFLNKFTFSQSSVYFS